MGWEDEYDKWLADQEAMQAKDKPSGAQVDNGSDNATPLRVQQQAALQQPQQQAPQNFGMPRIGDLGQLPASMGGLRTDASNYSSGRDLAATMAGAQVKADTGQRFQDIYSRTPQQNFGPDVRDQFSRGQADPIGQQGVNWQNHLGDVAQARADHEAALHQQKITDEMNQEARKVGLRDAKHLDAMNTIAQASGFPDYAAMRKAGIDEKDFTAKQKRDRNSIIDQIDEVTQNADWFWNPEQQADALNKLHARLAGIAPMKEKDKQKTPDGIVAGQAYPILNSETGQPNGYERVWDAEAQKWDIKPVQKDTQHIEDAKLKEQLRREEAKATQQQKHDAAAKEQSTWEGYHKVAIAKLEGERALYDSKLAAWEAAGTGEDSKSRGPKPVDPTAGKDLEDEAAKIADRHMEHWKNRFGHQIVPPGVQGGTGVAQGVVQSDVSPGSSEVMQKGITDFLAKTLPGVPPDQAVSQLVKAGAIDQKGADELLRILRGPNSNAQPAQPRTLQSPQELQSVAPGEIVVIQTPQGPMQVRRKQAAPVDLARMDPHVAALMQQDQTGGFAGRPQRR